MPARAQGIPADRALLAQLRPDRGLGVFAVMAVLIGVVALVRTTAVFPVHVASASMEPTLSVHDVVLVSRQAPLVSDLRRGDLVTFRNPEDGERTLKRVIGLPGEAVVVLDGVLHVDGEPVDEPYVDPELVDGYYMRTFHVPDRAVFVLGDNRANSVDSRDYGPVPEEDLLGRVLGTIWPVG